RRPARARTLQGRRGWGTARFPGCPVRLICAWRLLAELGGGILNHHGTCEGSRGRCGPAAADLPRLSTGTGPGRARGPGAAAAAITHLSPAVHAGPPRLRAAPRAGATVRAGTGRLRALRRLSAPGAAGADREAGHRAPGRRDRRVRASGRAARP